MSFKKKDLDYLNSMDFEKEKVIIEVQADARGSQNALRFPVYTRIRLDRDEPSTWEDFLQVPLVV